MGTTTIGVDLGVTSASDVAVAEGTKVTASRKAASTPEALTAMFAKLGANGPVNVVVESTAMAWFVAAVAVLRSGIDATVFRVSGTKAAALRKFYRAHTKTDRIDARVLARMPLVDDSLHELVLAQRGRARPQTAGGVAQRAGVGARHRPAGPRRPRSASRPYGAW